MPEGVFANVPIINVGNGKSSHGSSPNADVAGVPSTVARYGYFPYMESLDGFELTTLFRNANANHGVCIGIGASRHNRFDVSAYDFFRKA